MRIAIGGDLIPTEKNIDSFRAGDASALLDEELSEAWYGADYRICNLETVLTTSNLKLGKHGRNIKTAPDIMPGIKALDFSLLCCANNHILDFGHEGLDETKLHLDSHGIRYIGISENKDDLRNYCIFDDGKIKTGIYNCADTGFSSALTNAAGATPFDCYGTLNVIREMKEKADWVVVIYHAGIEFYPYPTPLLRSDCKAMVDAGADVVICQHCHCIASKETYHDSEIIYGHGHFISNLSDMELLQDEFIVQIDFSEQQVKTDYIPVTVSTDHTLQFASNERAKKMMDSFIERSEKIKDESFIQKQFDVYVSQEKKNIIMSLKGHSIINRVLAKIFINRFIEKSYSQNDVFVLYELFSGRQKKEIIERLFEMKK